MARIDSFLRLVADQQASDLHFHSGNPPIIRYAGDLIPLPFRKLSRDETRRFVYEMLTPQQREDFERDSELDFIHVIEGVARFRANLMIQQNGVGAVFRIIPEALPSLDELRYPPIIRKLCYLQNGLILVCGPTGSGKTTTLAAMINEINAKSQRHIITVEDPIEFVHPPQKCAVTQRQVGRHIETFAGALRSALRESPDVLVIGEMRDPETIHLALSATETGVLVFGTLHTNSAAKAIDRIIDAVGEDAAEQVRAVLSVHLRAVISQQLCKRNNSDGRIAALEILLQNFAVANMIREGKMHQVDGYMQSASNDGTGTQALDAALLRLVKEDLVSQEEALKYANHPDNLASVLRDLPQEQ